MTGTTGPKVSSLMMDMRVVDVGEHGRSHVAAPAQLLARPPTTIRAPRCTASANCASTMSACLAKMNGPR